MSAKSSPSRSRRLSVAAVSACSLWLSSIASADIVDEAKAQGKTPTDFPADDYDYFRDMDMRPDGTTDASGNSILKPLDLAKDEVKGRNTWRNGVERFVCKTAEFCRLTTDSSFAVTPLHHTDRKARRWITSSSLTPLCAPRPTRSTGM
jgi:hypothetical protein